MSNSEKILLKSHRTTRRLLNLLTGTNSTARRMGKLNKSLAQQTNRLICQPELYSGLRILTGDSPVNKMRNSVCYSAGLSSINKRKKVTITDPIAHLNIADSIEKQILISQSKAARLMKIPFNNRNVMHLDVGNRKTAPAGLSPGRTEFPFSKSNHSIKCISRQQIVSGPIKISLTMLVSGLRNSTYCEDSGLIKASGIGYYNHILSQLKKTSRRFRSSGMKYGRNLSLNVLPKAGSLTVYADNTAEVTCNHAAEAVKTATMEDLRWMRKLAESDRMIQTQQVNTVAAPNIHVEFTGPIQKEIDVDEVISKAITLFLDEKSKSPLGAYK